MQKFSAMLLVVGLITALPVKADNLHDMLTASGVRAEIADQVTPSLMGSDRAGKDGPMAKVGPDLTLTYHECQDYAARGGYRALAKRFKPSRPLVRTVDESAHCPTATTAWVARRNMPCSRRS
jgi:hypothetical protein